MPFLAPLIGAAVGLGTIGTAVVEIGLAVGLGFAAKKLAPKQKKTATSSADTRGARVGLTIDTDPARQVIIGETATGGSLAYWQLSGTNNDVLHMVVALADHECTSLQAVLVNGKQKSWNAGTGQVTGYGTNLVVRFYSGAAGQTADSEVVAASGGRWTTNEKGTGLCYVVVKLTYDEEKFPEGIPDLAFVVRGAKLYDPRTGSTAYSDNPAVALYNVLNGISSGGEPLLGLNVPTSAIRLSEAQAAANACDELVALKAGGNEKRYRCGIVFDATQSNRDVIETLLAAMAGEAICVGGVWRIMAGVAQTPVAAITDADLITADPVTTRPKRSRNELTNAILGSYTDPSRGYSQVALPPRTSSSDETADGGIRLTRSLDLSAVTSRAQGQRVLEVERKRARRMASASMRIRARYFGLEPGDWVTWTSDRRGYDTKTFVVKSITGQRDLVSDIVLIETDAAIDDWTAGTDEIDDDQVIDLASAGPPLSAVSGVALVNFTALGAGGIQRPGLQLQWTAIDDPTVISLQIEFRKTGDTTALTTAPVLDPSVGNYEWVTGVQSGATYEARVRPVTRPQRSTTWSAWVPAADPADDQVVAVAATATSVPDDTITVDMLSPQARFEISLVTETDAVLGSVAEQIAALKESARQSSVATIDALLNAQNNATQVRVEKIERVAQDLVLAQQITTISAQINNTILAAIQEEQTARATADSTLAADIATTITRMDGNEVAVTVLQESINGIEGRWGVAINSNGQIVGLVQLDASATAGSTFTIVADNFKVAAVGAGGSAVPIFAIQNVNGVAKVALRGDMLADGTITAQKIVASSLSALSANLGTVTAGLIRDAANTYYWDLTNGRQGRYDGTYLIDMANKTFRITW